MAVTPFLVADTYALAGGGRTQFIFTGDGRLASSGTPAVNGFLLGGTVIDGTKIDLSWNGQTTTLVAKTAPSAPGEFQAGVVTGSYVADLVDFFQSHFAIQEDFSVELIPVTGTLYRFDLRAKQPGVAYNLADVSIPGIIAKNITPGADPIVRPNYAVYVELWVQPATGKPVRVDDAFLEAGENDRYGYNAGEVLHDLLMQPDWPAWHFPLPYQSTQSRCRYFLAYAEAYGNPRQPGRMKKTGLFHAYLGGVDYRSRAGGGKPLTSLTLAGGQGGTKLCKALRLGPDTRYVRPEEPQYLSFINTTGGDIPGGTVSLEVVMTLSDGAEITVTDRYTRQAFLDGAKITFPVGPAQLELSANVPVGKTLLEYTVQLVAVTDASPAYKFVVDYRYERYVRYFGYLSSLGVIDTLLTYGKGSSELQLSYEQAERYLPASYSVSEGQFVSYDVQLQQQLEVATGYRSQVELRGFLDFYRSPVRFDLRPTEALPIGLLSKSIKQQKDGDTLFAHAFQYQYLFREDYYSASEEDELAAIPPQGFQPAGGGTVIVAQPVLVPSVDKTVPDAVRTLSTEKIADYDQAVAQVQQIADKHYLDQATGNQLYRRADLPINYVTDLTAKPTNRDEAGLTDVPTTVEARQDALNLFPLTLELTSWLTPTEPS